MDLRAGVIVVSCSISSISAVDSGDNGLTSSVLFCYMMSGGLWHIWAGSLCYDLGEIIFKCLF